MEDDSKTKKEVVSKLKNKRKAIEKKGKNWSNIALNLIKNTW